MFGGLNLTPQQLRGVDRIVLTACGTSWHAALVGEYLIEELARIPVEVEYASELRYRNPPLDDDTLLFAITQSGETADTLAALREMKRKGHPTLAICNVVGSTIAREADGGIYLHAGPEIGVASTKAFTSQVRRAGACWPSTSAGCGTCQLRRRHADHRASCRSCPSTSSRRSKPRTTVPAHRRQVLPRATTSSTWAGSTTFPTALEGALKLKEISYIHAEGYPAAEMKHGPIALVDEHTPSVFVVPQGGVYDKVMSNLEEIKARGGPVIAVVGEGDTRRGRPGRRRDPRARRSTTSCSRSSTVVPLQLLAYHIAVLRGCDVDKPRNLAKSVTVE